ncbi:MAG: hypothetical protein AAF702_09155 [Chloroflexota bacterium]
MPHLSVSPAGGDQIITLPLQNLGPSDSSNKTLTHNLPAGVVVATAPTTVSAYVSSTITCSGTQTATLTCNIGELPANQTIDFYVPVDVTDTLTYCCNTFSASAEASLDDNIDGTQPSQAATISNVVCQSNLAIQQSAPAITSLGATYSTNITATNAFVPCCSSNRQTRETQGK